MPTTPHLFGGDWTTDKLERVRKYLVAYATIMRRQRFRYAYIDAFAGSGYRGGQRSELIQVSIIPELTESDSVGFQDGSARIALQVEPRFNKYIFIELDPARYIDLQELKREFPDKAEDIILVNAEANTYIQERCAKDWIKTRRRAVLFLDPYGMQVDWKTIEAIAKTKAIDLWILFPLSAATRMLPKSGVIVDSWRKKLDRMFGATDWYDTFYRANVFQGFFGEQTSMEKVANFDIIGKYFVERLKTVFAGQVAENPRPLYNSRNIPLYLLCFAAGNPKGAPTALSIAQDILKRD
jgi:three-Cys-motif partner protein